MGKSVKLLLATVVLSMFFLQGLACAQEKPFPTRQVNYVVCFDPGGQSDRGARIYQPHLEKVLGQKVIVDYKVGGGGALGWRELARSKPDGYTFAGFNIPHIILQPLQQEVGYKTEQIVPVMIFQRTPLGLAVLNTSPIKTLQDFIEFAKKNPGSVTVGGSGSFSGYHMATLRLEKLIGAKLTYVPFTGSAPQMTSFLGGHVTAVFGASDDLTIHRDKLRVIGFAMDERFPGFPDAPTLKEQGIDMAEAVDRGVAVPPGTPEPVIRKLESALIQVAKMPEIQAEMTRQGFIPMAMGHDECKAYVQKMTAIYKDLAAGIKK
ncbi:MAG: tripartite tricarboxylate transporter substrate binding protein [Desulfobacteraceae bacterium]|nr:tripartite tricarboxylate transporter substrate binding protein [Desulfobacteraceae bacterium]